MQYITKQNLNQQLLQLHPLLANSWNKSWPYIQNMIEEKPNETFKLKYEKLGAKLDKLMQEQIMTTHTHTRESFRPMVINKTDITFYNKDLSLLEKGLKYSLHTKKKNWIAMY